MSQSPSVEGSGWRTNVEKHIVDLGSLTASIPRDAIPPIYQPQFESLEAAHTWLKDDDVVGVLDLEDEAHVYPLRMLVWHEVVNDQIGGIPVLVTFCPLCSTLLAFDRRVGAKTLVFGVSGLLQNKNLIMWDHQTESWWQQLSGTALVGDMVGERLDFVPIRTLLWREVRQNMPHAQVLSREAGLPKSEADWYELKVCPSEYPGEQPLWTGGPNSEVLRVHDRVVGLKLAGAVAYPISALAERQVVNDVVDDQDLVLFYSAEPCAGTIAGLGAQTVDTTSVYRPMVGERKLSFYVEEGKILDQETGSTWSPGGLAVRGRLNGNQLAPVPYTISFWFSWVAFYPDTDLRLNE